MPAQVRKNMKAAKVLWDIIGVPDSLKDYYVKGKKPKQPQRPWYFTQKPY